MGFALAARDAAGDLMRQTPPFARVQFAFTGTLMKHAICPLAAIAIALLSACTASNSSYTSKRNAVDVSSEDFGCIREMTPVRGFYVDNLLGNLADTLAAANKPLGGAWPVGSVVQRIPSEVMVKHHQGYSPATNDWEFFVLDNRLKSTRIADRGFTNVVNEFGGNCLTCHSGAEPQWDMICEQGHGCDNNMIPLAMARALQNTDPRCPKVSLPPNQKAALRQLEAMRDVVRGSTAVQASR